MVVTTLYQPSDVLVSEHTEPAAAEVAGTRSVGYGWCPSVRPEGTGGCEPSGESGQLNSV